MPKLTFTPVVKETDNGRFFALLRDNEGKEYTIQPLGKADSFTIASIAERLAIGHSRIANSRGNLSTLPNVRAV